MNQTQPQWRVEESGTGLSDGGLRPQWAFAAPRPWDRSRDLGV